MNVSIDEEDKEEDEESGHDDVEEVVDDTNHTALLKDVVRSNSPGRRSQREEIWKDVRLIVDHDLTDHVMKTDYTNVCVYRLSDPEGSEKRYWNNPLKLFRSTKDKKTPWITSAALAHFKKNHEDSSSTRKQKAGLVKRQSHLGECMHVSDSVGIQSISSVYKKSTYVLSENEKVLSAITRWVTYANMKVSQIAFGDLLFVVMLQAAHGPHETKGLVPKLTRSVFKGFIRISGDIPLQYLLSHVPDAHILMNTAHLHKSESCEVQQIHLQGNEIMASRQRFQSSSA